MEEEDAAWRTPEKEVSRMRESKLNQVLGYNKDRGEGGGMRIGVSESGRKRGTESMTSRGGQRQIGSL